MSEDFCESDPSLSYTSYIFIHKNGPAFQYLQGNFLRLNEAKIKEGKSEISSKMNVWKMYLHVTKNYVWIHFR